MCQLVHADMCWIFLELDWSEIEMQIIPIGLVAIAIDFARIATEPCEPDIVSHQGACGSVEATMTIVTGVKPFPADASATYRPMIDSDGAAEADLRGHDRVPQ